MSMLIAYLLSTEANKVKGVIVDEDNVKCITTFENNKCSVEIVQCVCGYHMGIDATYIEQVDGINTECPACGFEIIYGYEED